MSYETDREDNVCPPSRRALGWRKKGPSGPVLGPETEREALLKAAVLVFGPNVLDSISMQRNRELERRATNTAVRSEGK